GLYAILGLKNKHIAIMLMIELLIISIGSIVSGTFSGFLLGKLAFLGLNRLLHFPVSMAFVFSFDAAVKTFGLFMGVFFLTWILYVKNVKFAKPAKLIARKNEGETKPKSYLLLYLPDIIL